ncbi:DEAD/DEAH box helicase [Desulforudis sp. 1088]|uniref:DEAD/DEAH box helicase n=1 Tax=unclassified Candidatus Desulforudis TaxID=2635950 RepID=UPI003494BB03
MTATSTFADLGLKPELMRAIEDLGYETPTPIQEKSIPPLLAGRDVLGQAQTGTGKTAAFGLPILQKIVPGQGLQALVLCPTRELAVQVATDITSMGRYLGVRVLPVYGGQSIEHQLRALKNRPEVVVGTPGRLMDHLQRSSIRLDGLRVVVLDEADEMLDMGFLDDIKTILAQCSEDRQTLLFAATMPAEIENLAKSFLKDPQVVAIRGSELTAPLIEQRYYEVNARQKLESLCRILDVEMPASAIIFCRTKRGADELAEALRVRGYEAEVIHGDLSQRERDSVMSRFRSGFVELLVASDVAARGLDISHVTHVINYDIAQDAQSYVNRIGRTGRAGREGVAITLVTPREIRQLRFIEQSIGKRIRRHALPTLADAKERRQQELLHRVEEALGQPLVGEYRALAIQLLENHESIELLAACLMMLTKEGRELETAELLGAEPESVTVKLPFGRKHGLHVRAVIDQLSRAGVRRGEIGNIKIFDDRCYVDVPAECEDQVYAAFRTLRQGIRTKPGKFGAPQPRRRSSKSLQ